MNEATPALPQGICTLPASSYTKPSTDLFNLRPGLLLSSTRISESPSPLPGVRATHEPQNETCNQASSIMYWF